MNEAPRWRRSDFISMATIVTVLGWVWYASAKSVAWDNAAKDIWEIKTKIQSHSEQLAAIDVQYQDIKDELRSINRKLGR